MNISSYFFEISKITLCLQIVLLFCVQASIAYSPTEDLVLINGKVWTGTGEDPSLLVVAVKGSRIVFVGFNEDAGVWIKPETRVIDLKGRLLLPGINDAHVHFSDGGFSLIQLNLRDAADRKDFARKIGNYAKSLPPDAWITGGNWDHENWPNKKYPDRWLIDPVCQDIPVLVSRLDGHVAVANSLALKIAGITKDTRDPQGGFIGRDPESGEPTGILKDNAMNLVSKHIPDPPDSVRIMAVEAALSHTAELGITSVQDVSPVNDFFLYQKFLKAGKLTCRIMAVMPIESHTDRLRGTGVEYHFGDPMLRIGGVKCFSDGSMGAGSALFFEAYEDDPSTAGLGIYSKQKLIDLIEKAHKYNLQVYAHAIGDKANRWVLDAFESAIKKYGDNGLRHRIEHAQVVTVEDLTRFAELNVVASVQPFHCLDDMRWAEKRIGTERCKNIYVFKSFLDSGAAMAFGTDWPVAPLNPMLGIYAAVTREFQEGGPEGGWFPEQKISLQQALLAYTLGAAYAEHEENNKGTIEVGKLADMIVLDQNLFEIPPRDFLKTKVDLTIMDGRVVFER